MKVVVAISMILSLLSPQFSFGHARFLPNGSTPGRSNNPGLKTGPCGGEVKAVTPSIEFEKGQTITLEWEETINHPGRFEFSISNDNDQTFELLLTIQDTQNDGNTPHRYSADLKLPNDLTCDNCTLQMIQQMTENPNLTRPYFSCADIRIVDSENPNPRPSPSPAPDPSPDCP